MKTSSIAIATLVAVGFAWANTSRASSIVEYVEKFVATDIQRYVDDTVNEGEQTATVVRSDGESAASCRITPVKKDPKSQWAFCKVQFEVSFEDLSDIRQCSLLYKVTQAKTKLAIERGANKLFSSCVERLSESL
jgi:hypothetical protein